MTRTLGLVLLIALAGCTRQNDDAHGDGDTTKDSGSTPDGSTHDGSSPDGSSTLPDGGDTGWTPFDPTQFTNGSLAMFCAGSDASGSDCLSGLAQTKFRFAVCSCNGLTTSSTIKTDSFDSSQGAYSQATAMNGGSLGSNGKLNWTGDTSSIGGSLWCSGSDSMTLDSTVSVAQELHVEGTIASQKPFGVAADAYLHGNITLQSALTIDGNASLDPGAVVTPAGDLVVIGTKTVQATHVPDPCDCAADVRLDVGALVDELAQKNDDATLSIDPSMFTNVQGTVTTSLACGRYYFASMQGSGQVVLDLSGRTAIFIEGDVSLNGGLVVNLTTADAEVDVFVKGNVNIGTGGLALGSIDAPAKARLYVGGSGTVNLSGSGQFAANVNPPTATISLASDVEIFGSLFASNINTTGPFTVHFDESILVSDCPPPAATTCTTCNDCGNQACVDGSCGACTDSSQCCAPLVCEMGQCVATIQ